MFTTRFLSNIHLLRYSSNYIIYNHYNLYNSISPNISNISNSSLYLNSNKDNDQNDNISNTLQNQIKSINDYCKQDKIEEARLILSDLFKRGITPNNTACTPIIGNYIKNNNSIELYNFLNEIRKYGKILDTETYSKTICLLCSSGYYKEAIHILNIMKTSHIKISYKSYIPLIRYNCENNNKNDIIKYLYELLDLKIDTNPLIIGELIECIYKSNYYYILNIYKRFILQYGKNLLNSFSLSLLIKSELNQNNIIKAIELLDFGAKYHIQLQNFIYNQVIIRLIDNNKHNLAFDLFNKMKERSIIPDQYTISILLNAFKKDINKASLVFNQAKVNNIQLDTPIYGSYIHACIKCNRYDKAYSLYIDLIKTNQKVIDKLMHNTIIKNSKDEYKTEEELYNLYKQYSFTFKKDPSKQSNYIYELCSRKDYDKAYELYKNMITNHLKISLRTFQRLLQYFYVKNDERGNEIYNSMKLQYSSAIPLELYNYLLGFCASYGKTSIQNIERLFIDMKTYNIKINITSFELLLDYLAKNSMFYKLRKYYYSMINEYNIKPSLSCYCSYIMSFRTMEEVNTLYNTLKKDKHIKFTPKLYLSLLFKSCFFGDYKKGLEIWNDVIINLIDDIPLKLKQRAIVLYIMDNNISEAIKLINDFDARDAAPWLCITSTITRHPLYFPNLFTFIAQLKENNRYPTNEIYKILLKHNNKHIYNILSFMYDIADKDYNIDPLVYTKIKQIQEKRELNKDIMMKVLIPRQKIDNTDNNKEY